MATKNVSWFETNKKIQRKKVTPNLGALGLICTTCEHRYRDASHSVKVSNDNIKHWNDIVDVAEPTIESKELEFKSVKPTELRDGIGFVTRFKPPGKNGFILQEVNMTYTVGENTSKQIYTECWGINNGKTTLDGDDFLLCPLTDLDKDGSLKVRLKAWFLPKSSGITMKEMGLQKNAVESAGCLAAKDGFVANKYKRQNTLNRLFKGKWKANKGKPKTKLTIVC